jgi:NAD(P)H-flavin reductase
LQYQAVLVESREIAPDTRHFVFFVEGVEQFPYEPGQFVSFTEHFDGKPITRAYSIASLPEGNRFELCVNEVKDGRFSPYLFRLQPGERVPMKGPVGTFTLRDPLGDALFVATGTGIAPMRGLLLRALQSGSKARLQLLFGVRYEHSLLYREELESLAAEYPNFEFIPTLSRPTEAWTGYTGRVQQHLDEVLGERRNLHVYVCGLKEMVNSVREELKARGFDRKQIIVEKYD